MDIETLRMEKLKNTHTPNTQSCINAQNSIQPKLGSFPLGITLFLQKKCYCSHDTLQEICEVGVSILLEHQLYTEIYNYLTQV